MALCSQKKFPSFQELCTGAGQTAGPLLSVFLPSHHPLPAPHQALCWGPVGRFAAEGGPTASLPVEGHVCHLQSAAITKSDAMNTLEPFSWQS